METAPRQTHVLYGAIAGIGMAIGILYIYVTRKSELPGVQYLAYLPFFLGVVLNGPAFSRANSGEVTFKEIFGSCMKATFVVSLIIVLYTLISFVAFPEIKLNAIAMMRAQPPAKGFTQDQVEKSISLMNKFYGTIMISTGVFSNLLTGALFSLIGAAVGQKKK